MKKSILFAAVAAMIVCSCGTAKQVNQTGGLGEELAKSPAQMYAEDPSAKTLRAYAQYTGLPSQPVEQLAAAQARGALASSIATLVETAIKMYAGQYGMADLTNEQIESVMSSNNKAEQSLKQVAKELVQYAPVKVANSYRQSNGTIVAHVCVELLPDNISKSIKENKEYQDAVNTDQRTRIDFASDKFDESMNRSFEALQQMKANKSR